MQAAGDELFVRAPKEHELDAFTTCIETAFAMRLPEKERELFLDNIDLDGSLAGFIGGELVGTLATRRLELTLPGLVRHEVNAVTEATVLPTHRRRGVLSAMMAQYFSDLHERHGAISMLSASEGAIYGRFGFGPAIYMADYVVEKSASELELCLTGSPEGSVRLLRANETREALPALFELARTLRVGEVNRPKDWWGELFKDRSCTDDPRYVACYELGGSLFGYVVYDIERYRANERDLVLQELVCVSSDAYRALWTYLLRVDLVARVVAKERPFGEPLRHLLKDPRALQVTRVLDRSWLRLVEVVPALQARRYRVPGRLVISLLDERCPWNTATYELVAEPGGRCSVQATDKAFELQINASDLASCYLGATSAAALLVAGRVTEAKDGAAQRFDVLFAADPAPFCTALD